MDRKNSSFTKLKYKFMLSFLKSVFGFKTSESNIAFKRLNVLQFKEVIAEENSQLIDVRTPNEYKEGAIKKAVNINVMSPDFKSRLGKLNPEKPIYFYCRSGVRSVSASKKAIELGFTEVYDLKGGYNAWKTLWNNNNDNNN